MGQLTPPLSTPQLEKAGAELVLHMTVRGRLHPSLPFLHVIVSFISVLIDCLHPATTKVSFQSIAVATKVTSAINPTN